MRAEALPQFPPADKHGCRPAIAFARVSIARRIIADRTAAGLSQRELAELAGVRQETISRIESGKHSPTVWTVDRIASTIEAHQQTRRRHAKKKGR